MKITSGSYAGISISAPKGLDVRPTLGKIKQAVFNMIRLKTEGAACIDLFAGTGAYGLEALSNGAEKAIFVESVTGDLILKNCEKLRIPNNSFRILKCDYRKAIEKLVIEKIKADLIFADPPYNRGYINDTLDLIIRKDLLRSGGLLVLEIQSEELKGCDFKNDSLKIIKNKKYGDKNIIIFERT